MRGWTWWDPGWKLKETPSRGGVDTSSRGGPTEVNLASLGVAVASATLYSALHSLLASDEAQAATRRVFGPSVDRWYRLAYNALAIATLVPLEPLLARWPDRTLYRLPAPWWVIPRLGAVLASAGLAYCLWLTDIWTFLGLRQTGWLSGPRRRLVDTGPYGWGYGIRGIGAYWACCGPNRP